MDRTAHVSVALTPPPSARDSTPDSSKPKSSLDVLVEAIQADLEHRWAAGEPTRLYEYEKQFPVLLTDPAIRDRLNSVIRRLRAIYGDPVDQPTPYPDSVVTNPHLFNPETPPEASGPLTRSGPTQPALHDRNGLKPPFPQAGDRFLGFALKEELGRGAFARVFLAEQISLANRPVALKITARPTREPQRLARLRHTNIVPIYSVHDQSPLQAVCMPFLGRRTLADVIKSYQSTGSFPLAVSQASTVVAVKTTVTDPPSNSNPALPALATPSVPAPEPLREQFARMSHPEAVLWVMTRLTEGLAHAHDVGILHLDLKPANVLFADDGQPLLLDFNLAYDVRAGERERAGGTLPYMAPEQLEEYRDGGPPRVDHRTDLYSLGVIFFELLSGRHPFPTTRGKKPDLTAMARERRAGAPWVRQYNPHVSPAVESIVRKLLAPEPAERYQSARDLLTDLTRHQENLPLRFASDRSPRERVVKWRRRHPRMALYGALFFAFAVAAGAGLVIYREAEKQVYSANTAQARRTSAELMRLRVDITSRDDARCRAAARQRATELLAAYGLPEARNWSEHPTARMLQADDRAAIGDTLGELALLMAHSEWLESRQGGDQASDAQDRAFNWNLAAEACFADRVLPQSVAEQRKRLRPDAAMPSGAIAGQPTKIDLYLTAAERMAEGRFHDAKAPLEALCLSEPSHFAGQFLLGVCCQQVLDHPRALERYLMAKALMPNDPRPIFNRGVLLLYAKRYRDAETEFTNTIERDPTHEDAYFNRGIARLRLASYHDSVKDFTQAMEFGRPAIQAYIYRARAYTALGQTENANRDRAAANQHTPISAMDYLVRGSSRLSHSSKDPEGALADFQKATELHPHYTQAWQNQAHVLSEYLERPDEAIMVLEKAIRISPDYAPARAGRAVLLARGGRLEEARAEAERALLLSTDPQITYQAACTFALTSAKRTTDRDRAMDLLKQTLRAGYRDFALIRKDRDLEPLRSHTQFNSLITAAENLSK